MKHEESDFEKRCRILARLNGWTALKLEKNGHKGVPDDLFINEDGRFFLIEFKKDAKQRPRPEQNNWLRKFNRFCALVGDEETFCAVLGIKR